jgi:hypothetical protein
MSTRFPTEAANADRIGDAADEGKRGATDENGTVGADGTPRGNPDGTPVPRSENRKENDKSGGGK